ncbi:MAG TPA: hypothetical protein VGH16_08965 [Candidatus Binatia bacterium]|jgi:hypothetical protein
MYSESYVLRKGAFPAEAGEATAELYPKISAEEWEVWKYFLPVRSHALDRSAVHNLVHMFSPATSGGIPYTIAREIYRASERFDKIEVWRAHDVEKDPIAVGIDSGERYMIARWGMAKLIPFEALKHRRHMAILWKNAVSWGALAGTALAIVAWGFLF